MNQSHLIYIVPALSLLLAVPASAQTKILIRGQVSDATTGAGISFASIAIKGTTAGAITDVMGYYTLRAGGGGDSLLVSCVGYQTRAYALSGVSAQTINVSLTVAANGLQEVKIYAKGGDPAYRIMRQAVARRTQFDVRELAAYEYESYSKTEALLSNLDSRPKKNGRSRLARVPAIVDEAGNRNVPVFISETYSMYYARSAPAKAKESVLKSRSVGIGISEGNLTAQLTGASFQQYNFYDNYVSILRKDLPSPLGQFWESLYTFRLVDTVLVGNVVCYQIDLDPKQQKDIAFTGTVWLDTTQLGLTKIDVHIDSRANINFVEDIELNQQWEAVSEGGQTRSGPVRAVRLPVQTSLSIHLTNIFPQTPDLLIRFLLVAQHPVVNQPHPSEFYEPALTLAQDYQTNTPTEWQQIRPGSITARDLRAFQVVDSVRRTQPLRTISEFIELATVGYIPIKGTGLDFGPVLYSYAANSVEGNRFRLGLRTNQAFNQRWDLNGYLAYGTRDQQLKYGVGVQYVLSKRPWMVVGYQRSDDIEQVGINRDVSQNMLFKAVTRFGTLRRPYRQETNYTYVRRDLGSGFTQTVGLRNQTFDPLYAFAYHRVGQTDLATSYRTTEVSFETRFSPGKLTLQDNNDQFSVGRTDKVIIAFRYDLGLPVLRGDFTYHRFSLTLNQSFRLGVVGRTTYQLKLGYTPSTVPYPLLFIPRASPSIYRLGSAYNLMNYFEFATDQYAGLLVEHRFQGFLFNRIPLVRALKWRFVATGKVLMGSASKANQQLTATTNDQGELVPSFQSLSSTPYVEVGYGIENIFKFLRVDAVHRLTYRTNPGVSTFGIRLSTRIGL